MNKQTLTQRQQEIYDFIKDKIVSRGYGPTVREIGSGFGIKSPNGVVCHLKALEKKGLISREANMSRAIQLSQPPQSLSAIPFLGPLTVGAGFPTARIGERFDFSLLINLPDLCCLRIRGKELQGELIDDGDFLIVRRQPTFSDGDLAVVVYDDGTTGLRRLVQEVHRIRLESARSAENPQFLDRIVVIGIVVGLVRQFESLPVDGQHETV